MSEHEEDLIPPEELEYEDELASLDDFACPHGYGVTHRCWKCMREAQAEFDALVEESDA